MRRRPREGRGLDRGGCGFFGGRLVDLEGFRGRLGDLGDGDFGTPGALNEDCDFGFCADFFYDLDNGDPPAEDDVTGSTSFALTLPRGSPRT